MSNEKNIYRKEYRSVITGLVKFRLEAGFTQTEVAEKLKKPQSYISKIENCQRRLDVLEAKEMCDLYGVSVEEIFD